MQHLRGPVLEEGRGTLRLLQPRIQDIGENLHECVIDVLLPCFFANSSWCFVRVHLLTSDVGPTLQGMQVSDVTDSG